jgi:hypothetical protein
VQAGISQRILFVRDMSWDDIDNPKTNKARTMFGFFKKKPAQQNHSPVGESQPEGQFINPIEASLTMLRMGRPDQIFEFMHALATSTVELALTENDPSSRPLVLVSADNYPTLAVFTQKERAAEFKKRHPEDRFFLPLPFTEVLKMLKKGAGIVINPYDEKMAYQMPPDMVDSIRPIFLGDRAEPGVLTAPQVPSAPPPLSKYRPGQVWAFHASTVAPGATLTILRVENHEQFGKIVHISVSGVRLPKGGTSIGHMPFAEASIDRSVTKMIHDGDGIVKTNEGYDQWREERGGVFTISVADGINSIKQAIAAQGGSFPG